MVFLYSEFQSKTVQGVKRFENHRYKKEAEAKASNYFFASGRNIIKTSLQRGVKIHLGKCIVLMILPQVHLRKPCYDFYFL